MIDYVKDEHRTHLIAYHLIWCPKRRKQVLVDEIKTECKSLIQQKCEEKGWKILGLSVMPDHVHLFIQSFPSNCPSEIVKEIKGFTAYHMRKKHEQLMKIPCMWTRSYFVSTVGNLDSEIIQKYIESQGKE